MVRRAVLVGVSYVNDCRLPRLPGAENDVAKAKSVLTSKFGFDEESVRLLIDRPSCAFAKSSEPPPTKKSVLEAIDWLVCGATEGDVLFFHFSGHGSQGPAGLACEGMDDVLLPSDVVVGRDATYNHISSDELKSKFAHIPKGVTVVQVFDTGLGVPAGCSTAGERGYYPLTWSSKLLSGGNAREEGKLAAIASCSAAATDTPIARELLFQWPSAWFAAAYGVPVQECSINGRVTGVFSHHFYDLLSSLEEPCLTNELVLSFVSRAVRKAGFKQQPQFVAVDRCVEQSPVLPPVARCPPSLPDDCHSRDACCPPADRVCDTKKPQPPTAIECRRPDGVLVGELVRLLGVSGFDIACRIQNSWSEMTVEAQTCLYLELQGLGGLDALKIGAELAGDTCFVKLLAEFGADAVYFSKTTTASALSTTSTKSDSAADAAGQNSTGEELGRCTWMFLHALADQYPDCPTEQQRRDAMDLLMLMTRIYPCDGCADHFKQLLEENPPRISCGYEFQQWMCEVHNVVNRKIGKPEFPCHTIMRRPHTSACLGGVCGIRTATKPKPAAAVTPAARPADPVRVPPPSAAVLPPQKKLVDVPAAAPFAAPKAPERSESAVVPPAAAAKETRAPWLPSFATRAAATVDTYPFLSSMPARDPPSLYGNLAARPSSDEKKHSPVLSGTYRPPPPPPPPAAPVAQSCPYCPRSKA